MTIKEMLDQLHNIGVVTDEFLAKEILVRVASDYDFRAVGSMEFDGTHLIFTVGE